MTMTKTTVAVLMTTMMPPERRRAYRSSTPQNTRVVEKYGFVVIRDNCLSRQRGGCGSDTTPAP